jgi:RHO1 GDP-GTP exchange protein 1/2
MSTGPNTYGEPLSLTSTNASASTLATTNSSTTVAGSSASTPGSGETDSRLVYPITLQHIGRAGGPIILYAETSQSRLEWKTKLEEALGIRKIVQESNKVFELEPLSTDTFLVPSVVGAAPAQASWNQDNSITGKVTCSVPFSK